mgnify:CR=1 FL=1
MRAALNVATPFTGVAVTVPPSVAVVVLPSVAVKELVRNNVDYLPLDEVEGSIATTLWVVYPPGIATIVPGEHPITPIMLGDAALAAKFADAMLQKGVYVIGFSYPVVPQGKARIRVQLSAAHTREDIDTAMNAFAKVRDACKK